MTTTKHMYFLLLLLTAALCPVAAQQKYTVSGTVKDARTGEQLPGALVSIPELKGTGMATNENGFYSLTLPAGKYTLLVRMVGYDHRAISLQLAGHRTNDVALDEEAAELEEVVVSAAKHDPGALQAQMGMNKLDIREISKIPVLMGEKDLLKTIQLLPGVKSAGEGNAGFHVRGGGADQNLILLDDAPVYSASHLLGFFSTFNSDAVKDITLYKGSMPAQYGGRLASVLDIRMNDGNDREFHGGGGIGLISSRLFVEGPIVKEKGSFVLSARRTYADAFLRLSNDSALRNNKLFFYDLNAKASYRINDNNRIYLSAYNGRDKLGFAEQFSINWGNSTATLRWNHLHNPRLFSNSSFIYSNYNYRIGMSFGRGNIGITSNVQDYNVKHEYQFFPDPKNNIRFGINAIYHTILPGQLSADDSSGLKPQKLQDKHALENAIYFNNEQKINGRLSAVYGLRLSSFSLLGEGQFFRFGEDGMISDTVIATPNQFVRTYLNLEPRLSVNYLLFRNTSLKGSYARSVQNLHLISNSTSASPTDLWIPSSLVTKPEVSDQVALGFAQTLREDRFELSAEIYYKAMQNQIDYRDGANTQANERIEGELLFGAGRAYGLELLLRKKSGKFTGWIGYTLSRSEKKINGINQGDWYLARQDRTHDLSVVGIYDLTKKWSLSATWVYNTGNAVTFPTGKYFIDGKMTYAYTERNGYRMPSYHRLDIGATWTVHKTARSESSWNFSVYNAYARENAYMIQFQQDPKDAERTQAIQTTLFRLVPSVTYNFKF